MDVGGSSSGGGWACFTGTRFRPLSFNLAKPLFPLAGQPMVHHPILACQKVPYIPYHGKKENREIPQMTIRCLPL